MAAALVLIVAIDTFATGFLLRHVLHLTRVTAQQGDHVLSLAHEIQQVVDALPEQ